MTTGTNERTPRRVSPPVREIIRKVKQSARVARDPMLAAELYPPSTGRLGTLHHDGTPPGEMLRSRDVAVRLGVTLPELKRLRATGLGPRHEIWGGSTVRYSPTAIDDWLARRAAAEARGEAFDPAADKADPWLMAELTAAGGRLEWREVLRLARQAGFPHAAIRRAQVRLGLERYRETQRGPFVLAVRPEAVP